MELRERLRSSQDRGLQSGFGCERCLCAKSCYSPKQASAVTDRDAEFLEVAIGQVREDVDADVIIFKLLLVSAQAQTAKPHPDIHDRALIRGE
jgi:hypothetical protein